MSDEIRVDAKRQGGQTDFVRGALGRWSSHPEMLGWQRKVFRLIGFLPIVIGVAIALLILTNYRALDFSDVHDIPTMCNAFRVLIGRCWMALLALLCALCVTWGFSITANLLWSASRKFSTMSPKKCADRDVIPIPPIAIAISALFWLAPALLPLFRGVIMAIDVRLYWLLVVLSNICSFMPFVLLWIWFSVGAAPENLFKEGRRHPYSQLFAWLGCLALAFIVLSTPDIPPVTKFVDGPFAKHINTSCPWVLKVLDVTVPVLFRWCRILLALYLGWRAFVHFLKWRLKWVPRRGTSAQNGNGAGKAAETESPGDGVVEGNTAADVVKRLIADSESAVTLEGEILLRTSDSNEASPCDQSADPLGVRFLIDLPEGGAPTKDQRDFFERFVAAYEESRNAFLDNEDPRRSQTQADLILHGPFGSGRTTVLMAAALYAAAVRGQRVLFVVSSHKVAERLAKRINDRLRVLMVDCYFSAGVLKSLDVDSWLEAYSTRPDENGVYNFGGTERLPPDVLFATPEMIERYFFSNAMTLDAEKRSAMRRLLVSFGLFVVDDFLEYPVAVRSHLAFLMDKFRLLLETEFVVPQFIVATTPLDTQNNIDIIGQRLFGFNRFNRMQNVRELRPRNVAPFMRGTLIVKRGRSIASAIRALLEESLSSGLGAMVYWRGISACERTRLEEEFRPYVSDGKLRIIGHFDELDDVADVDIALFVSSDDKADMSLRLNMAEDASPLFFRIKPEGEVDMAERSIVLIPDETAVSLRAFHLRSVLQYIPPLTPVEASIWSCLGVFGKHPNMKNVSVLDDSGSQVAVQWYQDDFPVDERYVEGQIWACLVLVTKSAISTRGQLIDFSVLPIYDERIWVDRASTGLAANRLLLLHDDKNYERTESDLDGEKGKGESRRQMVSWRDSKNVSVGETDLAHSEEMVYTKRGSDVCDDEEYTVGGIPPQEDLVKDPGRFAFAVTARYRRGTEDEYIIPVRRFSWDIPTRNMEIVDLSRLNGLAQFMIRLKDDLVYRVDGFLKSLLNLRGLEQDYYPPKEFAYDAYMSCVVLEPTFKRLKASSTPEDYVRECMRGKWTTSMKSGFSPALTHALAAAFRRRFSGWPFFALAPVFYIEGREGSVGKAVMWIVEPANSGRTVWPALKVLLEESAFWTGVFEDACDVLRKCTELWQLRICSKLAFSDERLEQDDADRALAILESIRDKRKAAESVVGEDGDDEDDNEKAEDDGDGAKDEDDGGGATKGDDHKIRRAKREIGEFTEEEKEFEKVVLDALNNFEDTIDVADTAYVRANFMKPERVTELFNDILWNHPEIFYISKSYRYYREWLSDGTIKSFLIQDIEYGITRDQYAEAKARLDEAVSSAMGLVKDVTDPVLKALKLHDYIIRTCDYDEVARDESDSSPLARTAYSVLVRHLAVCEGYTMAYRYLLAMAGITSEEVISEPMSHCWNYVKLNGHWYHVDVTWDDKNWKNGGADDVMYECFLLSDKAMLERKHHDWFTRGLPPATDTWYDNFKWADSAQKSDHGDGASGGKGDGATQIEKYRSHIAFRALNRGCSLYCRGDVRVRVFFVDDADSSWDETARIGFLNVLESSMRFLETRAREDGVSIAIRVDKPENKRVLHSVRPNDNTDKWIAELFGTRLEEDQRRFRAMVGCDESPIIFAFNKEFRSCALSSKGGGSGGRNDPEWSLVSYSTGCDEMRNVQTVVHELLHQFGAMDLYYPKQVADAGAKYLQNSIMSSGMEVDDLTRFLVGWRRGLSDNAINFLEATKDITESQISRALEDEWRKSS